uniref:Uncharacterized protein n=1 Tax=Romanomermis culicivorax TaxID=13658 RepID=A0A915L1A7_ROMCU
MLQKLKESDKVVVATFYTAFLPLVQEIGPNLEKLNDKRLHNRINGVLDQLTSYAIPCYNVVQQSEKEVNGKQLKEQWKEQNLVKEQLDCE